MWKKWLAVCAITLLAMTGTMQQADAASFKDMKKNKSSLYVEVNYLADQGIISGYPDGNFKPNEPIAKKHIAAMLVKALDLPMTNLQDPGYRDIPKSHPYFKQIAAAYTAGLFSKADRFKPESSISRAFMARLMSKAFHLKVQDKEYAPSYSDVGRNSEFHTDIMRVTTNNVATGYPDGTFKPKQLITRAHFSAFLTRAMTVRSMNIMPDSNYTYYYTDGESTYRYDHEGIDSENGLDYWIITNETEYEDIPRLGFVQDSEFYGEGYDDWFHYDQIIWHPFAVKQIFSQDDMGPVNYGDVWITDTNATKTVRGREYRDVLVLEHYLPWNNETVIEYYAKDIGLIQRTDGKGNELYGLVERVKN